MTSLKDIFIITLTCCLLTISTRLLVSALTSKQEIISGAPPYNVADEQEVPRFPDRFSWLNDWQRPAGPARVGLQVGHWKNHELPEELSRLHGNTGATGGGKTEAEINLEIALATKVLLEKEGVVLDILPATVPPKYWADVFMAIHADGSTSSQATGYKFAGPWRDFTDRSDKLVAILENTYGQSTGLSLDPHITRNMRGYYAFSWWRFEHAIHPMTTAVIAETGFLTSPADRKIIVERQDLVAEGLAKGILLFLREEELL